MKSTGYEHQNHKFRVFRQSPKIPQILFRIKAADIYLKAHGKYRKEGKSRDTAEDVVRKIM